MPPQPDSNLRDNTSAFYEELAAFDDFEGFTDPSRYRPLPADWQVALADIQGSTKAIAEGRYKDVNMMGAACITAVLNTLKQFHPVSDIPYVFGGDGAAFAVPGYTVDRVRDALTRTKTLCETRFGLAMRIGIVPIADLRELDRDILVAKFRLSPGNHLALFSGGGIELADKLIKDEAAGAPYREAATGPGDMPDLAGLTCRWAPIGARNGKIVSVLVMSTETDPDARVAVFRNVIACVNEALQQNFGDLSPSTDAGLRFRWPPAGLRTEAGASAGPGRFAYLRRLAAILAQSALQWMLHRAGGKAGSYDAPAYKAELIANTDFRRFDDMLRLVLDCSAEQVQALDDCLGRMRRDGGIAYGLHAAHTALMTCLVFNLEKSEHVHFLDGGDGGFAEAARHMKAQLAERG
ncbi:MAG: DUF3095 domain-containing protein [Alphaproteobacteria bacterium]|nr:DUF3095 domain-containing protein [Alphaproteobacteria bacterium]